MHLGQGVLHLTGWQSGTQFLMARIPIGQRKGDNSTGNLQRRSIERICIRDSPGLGSYLNLYFEVGWVAY